MPPYWHLIRWRIFRKRERGEASLDAVRCMVAKRNQVFGVVVVKPGRHRDLDIQALAQVLKSHHLVRGRPDDAKIQPTIGANVALHHTADMQ